MSNSTHRLTFVDLYADGSVTADDIDDFVDRWHEETPTVDGRLVPMSEFLGMTRDEYEAWVRDASMLPHIVRARQEQRRKG